MKTDTLTQIGCVAGVAYYEHPTMGDDAPLMVMKDGELVETEYWELSDARNQMFLGTADDRHTDRALMEAILRAAGDDVALAERVWEGPTDAELVAIVEIVTHNGRYETTDFRWGAAGSDWAKL